MAVASLQSLSVLEPTLSQEPQSDVSRGLRDEVWPSNRTSSIFQRWRDLEDESSVNNSSPGRDRLLHQRSDTLSRLNSSDSQGIGYSVASEDACTVETEETYYSASPPQSENGQDDAPDIGERERERVRQVFQEWRTNCSRELTSSVVDRNHVGRAEWLGDMEQERVRVIREWVHLTAQQRASQFDQREDRTSETVGRIEQVLDGLVSSSNDDHSQNMRRGIRRLCGRQVLLDMLKKAQRERQIEIQQLLEHRVVSQFGHRLRIQSILRARFLRRDRSVDDGRNTSRTNGELGLLRQRHTVTDLREGFISNIGPSTGGQRNYGNDINNYEDYPLSPDLQYEFNSTSSNISWVSDSQTHSGNINYERTGEIRGIVDMQRSVDADAERRGIGTIDDIEQQVEVQALGSYVNREWSQDAPNTERSALSVANCFNDEDDLSVNPQDSSMLSKERLQNDHEALTSNELPGFVVDAQSSELNEAGVDHSGVLMYTNFAHERHLIDNDVVDDGNLAEELLESENRDNVQNVWNDDAPSQDDVDNIVEHFDQAHVVNRRMDSLYLPDTDTRHGSELQELMNRRSVSTLLRSGFRQNLDQLIQSYAQRQNETFLEDELPEAPPEMDENHSHQIDETQAAEHHSSFDLSPPLEPSLQQLWEQDSQNYDWAQSETQAPIGIEWDIINDMRVDMARLQQRMNNMQRMLETCMDMQLELQRSIKQEVSSALSRPTNISGLTVNFLAEDESKWDDVRKGLCCVCRSSSIDSLLYRCGHLCTCVECANDLLQNFGKCPMCWAPVAEVIRAYFM